MFTLLAAVALSGCPKPCEQLGACACHERSDCQMTTEPCWCPSECDPGIVCVCGGGKFLSCSTKR